MIETVVVSLGGVAARFDPERRLSALADLSGLPASVVHERLFESGFDRAAELGTYAPDTVLEAITVALEQLVPRSAILDAWALAFQLDDVVLRRLASLPVHRVLLTNNGPMLEACISGPLLALSLLFSEVVCSWHLRGGSCRGIPVTARQIGSGTYTTCGRG